MTYYRPIPQTDRCRPRGAQSLAGGRVWFTHAECIARGHASEIISAQDIPEDALSRLTVPRPAICGLDMSVPHIMAVLNVTPDSFSDGGRFDDLDKALSRAYALIDEGASLLDIGGESTRPGADVVNIEVEKNRTLPVIEVLRSKGVSCPISIDTRKAAMAKAAVMAGADMFNDVTALTFDPDSVSFAATVQPYLCLMHSLSDPKTMQDDPKYDHVVLDVYDYLAERIAVCAQVGVPKERIVIDPGIGFGKTVDHNLQLIRGLSVFHGLGCPVLLGVSRKRFIGTVGDAQNPADRLPGSLAIALEGLRQGVQILRVHDVWQTKQAMKLWQKTL